MAFELAKKEIKVCGKVFNQITFLVSISCIQKYKRFSKQKKSIYPKQSKEFIPPIQALCDCHNVKSDRRNLSPTWVIQIP